MRIPEIQARLRKLTLTLAATAAELAALTGELSRRKPVTRGARYSRTLTPDVRAAITRVHHADPGVPQHVIAKRLNINPGLGES
jgi:hypothetical protein